jgi:hypothetical protein
MRYGLLAASEADVRSGKANVRVVRKNEAVASGGAGGGGAFGWPTLMALLVLVAFRSGWRQSREMAI